ncbi:hypothetical protein D3Y57_05700 [Sphingomonas paeninsulae]|jgi:Ni/Co efflux regulator RcnB|uniref:Uncharacterized protein n=1 Tax=Sphingomonas paeninsulae TaxID=2319844 RepID=A0A494TIB4_SPHPE|nr:RcnB family protein [Sphingomonas paeninsulae]AYJ85566.1 hypothetical protein D3Y57_05700 [Sphingomonas paeninsulae]
MKHILAVTTALAVMLTGPMASAQDRRDDGRSQHQSRDGHGNRGGYNGGRGGHDRGNYGRYARGQRYRGDGAYVSDYRRYGYRAPPRGYRYYRSNNGDVVLAAIATGIIASVIANNNRGY